MKNYDEMDRSIQLRSEEIGYKTALSALSLWTLYNIWQTLAGGERFNILPVLISCAAICAQGFAQAAMKQRMVAGDEEYRQPNTALRMIVLAVAIAGIAVALGSYFLMKR